MRNLCISEYENIQGGKDFVDGLCAGVAVVSFAAGVGAVTNWWNPAGWVSIGILAADAACLYNTFG